MRTLFGMFFCSAIFDLKLDWLHSSTECLHMCLYYIIPIANINTPTLTNCSSPPPAVSYHAYIFICKKKMDNFVFFVGGKQPVSYFIKQTCHPCLVSHKLSSNITFGYKNGYFFQMVKTCHDHRFSFLLLFGVKMCVYVIWNNLR